MAVLVVVAHHHLQELAWVVLLHKLAQVVLVMVLLADLQFLKAHHFLLVAVVVQAKLVQQLQVI
jgi:hypothetical protein